MMKVASRLGQGCPVVLLRPLGPDKTRPPLGGPCFAWSWYGLVGSVDKGYGSCVGAGECFVEAVLVYREADLVGGRGDLGQGGVGYNRFC